jgi:hypothetical protein
MGCGCGKSNRSVNSRTPTRNLNKPANMTVSKTNDTVPVNATRMQALTDIKQNVEQKYMDSDRLRVEQLRRDAIRRALGK